MKLLIVAFSNSIHTARWLSQIADCGWDVHLFPSDESSECHPELRGVTVHYSFYKRQANNLNRYRGVYVGWTLMYRFLKSNRQMARALRRILGIIWKMPMSDSSDQLADLIARLRPDIVHSLETQHAGYLVLEARKKMSGREFPAWIHTNWGSDIYLFGRLKEHTARIKELLTLCDYYTCECTRDVQLARKYGFSGTVALVEPNTGGFDLKKVRELILSCSKTSERRVIMLKGYQGWSGRALVGIRALSRVRDLLTGFQVKIYSSNHGDDIKIAAELLSEDAGIPVTLLSRISHDEILRLHGMARISIGLGISDAVSTSLLEAMVMGSFPIQSWTAAADEWIEHGKSGMLVPPEDPEEIEQALRIALTNDQLVDSAAAINWATAEKRLEYDMIKSKVVAMYQDVYEKKLDALRGIQR